MALIFNSQRKLFDKDNSMSHGSDMLKAKQIGLKSSKDRLDRLLAVEIMFKLWAIVSLKA